MTPERDKQRMTTLYRERFAEHGESPQSLGWTKGKQDIRFDVLLSGFHPEGCSILDVGCGFGDLNVPLRERCQTYEYLGVDLMPEFVEKGRARYTGDHIGFRAGSFLEMEFDRQFDLCLASGIFNFRMEGIDHYAYVEESLAKMFALSKVGVAVDFLSDRVNFEHDHAAYNNPERVFAIAMKLTRCVRLRHDYMPFEFAITLYRDDSFQDADTVFNHYKHERPDH